jgi:Flp pilus assembly protein TadG
MFNAIVGNYATLRRLLSLQPRRFRNDEDGAMIVFGLIFFVLMLMIGGLAVDFMRFEYTRTRLQNTLDRATLAAASLDQQLDPTLVVKDYLLKANMA